MQARLDRIPDAMSIRRQTVEHPFATLKSWIGSSHFLTRTLAIVRTEMSLHVLAYNVKRIVAICGVTPLLQASEPEYPGQLETHAAFWIFEPTRLQTRFPIGAPGDRHGVGGASPLR
jgi:hypothetical protein